MNTISKKSVVVASCILVSGLFINCNRKEVKTKNESTKIAQVIPLTKKEQKEILNREPIVFIAGFDKGNENFYTNARTYYQEKGLKVIDGQYSLEEIIVWLNTNGNQNPYGEIHIVNQSNPFKGMNLETIIRGDRITAETLRKTITQGTLPTLKDVVNSDTKIVFHASGLAEDKLLVATLKDAFSAKQLPKVIASPYYNVFGGEFSDHYLAQPYYIFYPTANSPGKVDLSKEIAEKYPEENEIDWLEALNNDEERYVGEAFTTQFSIPIKWEFDYHNSDDEMPTFFSAEAVMDWIEQQEELMVALNKYNVSIEKYRWSWSSKNSKLVIRGRTTGLCILKPLIKPYGDLKHIAPDTSNKRLYAMQ